MLSKKHRGATRDVGDRSNEFKTNDILCGWKQIEKRIIRYCPAFQNSPITSFEHYHCTKASN